MAIFKVNIYRVEYFSENVTVEAATEDEAEARVREAWPSNEALYERVTDCIMDSETDFHTVGVATEEECKYLTNIDYYETTN